MQTYNRILFGFLDWFSLLIFFEHLGLNTLIIMSHGQEVNIITAKNDINRFMNDIAWQKIAYLIHSKELLENLAKYDTTINEFVFEHVVKVSLFLNM